MPTTTIETEGMTLKCEFDYVIHEGMKGSRDSFGVPMEPDDPPEIDLYDVFIRSATGTTYEHKRQDRLEWFELFENVVYDQILNMLYEGDIELR